jgi:hypothetical protein
VLPPDVAAAALRAKELNPRARAKKEKKKKATERDICKVRKHEEDEGEFHRGKPTTLAHTVACIRPEKN